VEVDQLSGLISVMGGKWTTYRAMAEDTINVVQEFIGEPVTSSATGEYLLSGARGWDPEYWRTLIHTYGVPQAVAQHLVQKFGTHASRVLALTRVDPNLGLLLLDGFPTLRAEVLYAARYEMATTIEDVLMRRSGLQLFSWRGAISAAPLTASILASEFDWNSELERTSIERYVKKINHLISTAGLSSDGATYTGSTK
jgi:glycerol-3-phosphate dehydrogenase